MGLAFAEIAKEQHEILEKWLGPLRERHWLILNRRRTQRVLVQVPLRVSAHQTPASRFDEETHTLALSPHGALILLSTSLGKGERLELGLSRCRILDKSLLRLSIAGKDGFTFANFG